ncbi:MAG: NADAR family protein [Xanthomonadales bacterium]|nr:NADAR family protein [Xanthomonadales bacterium]
MQTSREVAHETTEQPAIIRFYSVSDDYGEFSNFSPHPIRLDGQLWPSSEHYFQAQKFEDAKQRQRIRGVKSPAEAARLGRDRKQRLRRDWESVKVQVMHKAVVAKFTQHPELRELLLSTNQARIVEHTENDAYWGDGGDGSGRNMLGQILMRVRAALQGSE